MSRVIVSCVGMVAGLAVLTSCASAPKTTSDKDVFGVMQGEASKITENGGLAAVGMGESRSMPLAVEKAKADGRTELAMIINTKVDALRKRFVEGVGEGKNEEINALFSSAAKQLASADIAGTVPKDIKFDTKDGITRAYALMMQNPKILAAALENAGQANKSMYNRFRASQAFSELDAEVKKYEEFKKQQGM
jgi:hypothetical protein